MNRRLTMRCSERRKAVTPAAVASLQAPGVPALRRR
jgi:hypothetical protein